MVSCGMVCCATISYAGLFERGCAAECSVKGREARAVISFISLNPECGAVGQRTADGKEGFGFRIVEYLDDTLLTLINLHLSPKAYTRLTSYPSHRCSFHRHSHIDIF